MKRKILLSLIVFCVVTLTLSAVSVAAETYGDLTYSVYNGEVTITGYTGSPTAIEIPSTINGLPVTKIGEKAFYSCKSLTSITIPDSITSIGGWAFYGCSGLKEVHISSIEAWCNIKLKFRYDSNPLEYAHNLYLNDELVTDLEIPDGITSIGSSAFSNCTGLTSVTIPDSVTSIGDYAFNGCTGLTSITIPDSVTNIGENVFYGTAYYNDDSNWENNVLYIGNNLIKAKSNLSGDYIIRNNTKTIADRAFYGCSALTSINIPDGVTNIGDNAFYNCNSLTSIIFPDSITSIGNYSFYNCTGLTNIDIPDSVISVGVYAFYDCTGLTSISIGNGVTNIGNNAFYNCNSLTNIDIPDSVISIGNYAFSYCKSLTSITIGNSVTRFGSRALGSCSGLTGIWVDENNPSYSSDEKGVLFDKDKTELIQAPEGLVGEYFIPKSVTSIGSHAFEDCINLTSVTIPDSVTSISGWAFYGCSDLTGINIPNSVTSIGSWAFNLCTGLTSITIPDSVTSIGTRAFNSCIGLTNINISDSVISIDGSAFNNTAYYNDNSNWENNVLYIGNHLIQAKSDLAGDCTIRNNTKNIAISAFGSCKRLTSITIPNSVTNIESEAFKDCTGLNSITIGNGIASIGNSAFYGCTGLKKVNISSIETWCNISFDNLSANPLYYANNLYLNDELVTDLEIPDDITSIGNCSFVDCKSLTSIIIPDSVTSIGYDAFYGCTNLTSINIPDSVTSIGSRAFYGCAGLTSFTIGNGVTRIGFMGFYYCTGLTSITIPDSITSIGDLAFQGCTNLTSINISNSVTSIGYGAFIECNSLSNVFYNGDKQQWNKIYIESENDCLKNAKREYFWYVSFVDENGTEISKKKYEPGSLIDISDIEEKPEHTINLYTDKECQNEFDSTTPVTENLTLYIRYVPNKYNAKFLDEDGSVLKEGLNDYGEVITPPENPTKENTQQYTYSFAGWDGFYEGITQTNREMVFTAKYTETVNQYTYKFLDEDGTVLKEATEDYGTVINVPEHSDKTEYYIFDSWKNYEENMVLTDNIEFTAVYKYKDYSVTAIGLDNPIVVTYNSDYRIEPQAKDGCKFVGYYTEPDGKGTKVTGENGECLKAYDFVVDITVYPYFYNLYTNKLEIQGSASAMPGDEIKQKAVFATDKEAKYFVATVKYPKYLNFKSISAVDFAEVSKDSEKEEDGFKYTDITCMYASNENMPVNENLVPFEIVFEAEKDAPLGNAEITLQNASLIGDNGEYRITDINGNNIAILGKLAEKIEIIGENSIDKATKFTAVVSPEYTANKNVTWSVDNEAVASVSENGTLTPHKNGSVILTATTQDGSDKSAVKTVNVTAYAKLSSLKYGDTDIELEPYKYDYTIYVKKDLSSISITPTFQEGALKSNGTGIWISGKAKEFDLIDDETVITLNRSSVPGMTDSEYKITVLKYEGTQTIVSEDKKEFTVKPINFEKKCIVILALYNGNRFVGMQTALFDGEDLHFTTDIEYTTAKVMAWDNFSAMIPLSKAELIK